MWFLFKFKARRVMFPLHLLFSGVPLYLISLSETHLSVWLFLLGMTYANFMEWYNHKVSATVMDEGLAFQTHTYTATHARTTNTHILGEFSYDSQLV